MPVTITPPSRAVDLEPLRESIRARLLANSTIAALGAPVVSVGDVTDSATGYIAVGLLAYVPKNAAGKTQGCAYMQISCVSLGSPDDARAMRAAVGTALIDAANFPWVLAGWIVNDVQLAGGLPDVSPLVQAKVVWTERDRYEFTITRTN